MSWRQGRSMDLQAAVTLLVPTSHLEPFSVLDFYPNFTLFSSNDVIRGQCELIAMVIAI